MLYIAVVCIYLIIYAVVAFILPDFLFVSTLLGFKGSNAILRSENIMIIGIYF